MTAFFPPLVMAAGHLLTESPHSVDFAVQFLVLAGVVVIVGELAGHQVAWWVSAPFVTTVLMGVVLHRVGDAWPNT